MGDGGVEGAIAGKSAKKRARGDAGGRFGSAQRRRGEGERGSGGRMAKEEE